MGQGEHALPHPCLPRSLISPHLFYHRDHQRCVPLSSPSHLTLLSYVSKARCGDELRRLLLIVR